MDFEVSVHAMMAAFYCGTGVEDIAEYASFFCISGGKSWERAFSRHSPRMCRMINSVVKEIMVKSLKQKITAIIANKLSDLSNDEIKKVTAAYFAKDTKKYTSSNQKNALAVSYDMGW